MKRVKKLASLLLALAMIVSTSIAAFGAEGDGAGTENADDIGNISIQNATIGETYHIYKLFDVTYGESYVDKDGKTVTPTAYQATKAQKDALKNVTGNVFQFTELEADTTYQVTVGKKADGTPYSEEEVINFIRSFTRTLSGGVVTCEFPGAQEIAGADNEGIKNTVATASTIQWKEVPYGYYFVTSTLGSVVSLSTSNPSATVTDKNTNNPGWNNEPDEPEPDGPVKDVLNEAGQSINQQTVEVDDVLTYSISYTNKAKEGEEPTVLDSLVITDAAPEGTEYVSGSAKAKRSAAGEAAEINEVGKITWTFKNIAPNETVEVQFRVKVNEAALNIENKTVVNDANVTVKIGPNNYDMKTNVVENPVEPKHPDNPVKDVLNGEGTSINGDKVAVGDTLTYQICYTNTAANALESVVITDAAPTGTVYVDGSAKAYLNGALITNGSVPINIDKDGKITWSFSNVAVNASVEVRFDVKVTETAQSIIDKTIVNDALVKVNDDPEIKTNQVKNPVEDEPGEPNPGKVIVNGDGTKSTTSTGSFGDAVNFDVSINAVNQVEQAVTENGTTVNKIVQVKKYYIYDQLSNGFTFDEDSMAITINGKEYTRVGYDIKDGEKIIGTLSAKKTENGTVIVGTILWADETTGAAFYPNCKIHLTYKATINSEAVIAGEGNPNRVYYDYSTTVDTNPHEPDPENPEYPDGKDLNHGSEERKTTTYTYALGIQKYSAETGEPLEDAQFTAVDAGGNAIHAVPVTGNAGQYNYTSDSTVKGATNTFTTNAEGQIIIKGVDIGTYTFTETKAPKGYNLLEEPVSVTAQMDSSTETHNTTEWNVTRSFEAITKEEFEGYTGDVYEKSVVDEEAVFTVVEKPEQWSADSPVYKLVGSSSTSETKEEGSTTVTFPVRVAELEVENHAGSLLPGTGGVGTTIFYILGAALVVGAGILLVVRRRMSTEK